MYATYLRYTTATTGRQWKIFTCGDTITAYSRGDRIAVRLSMGMDSLTQLLESVPE